MVHLHNQVFSPFASRKYFCFGGGGGGYTPAPAPAVEPIPEPAPQPAPMATEIAPQVTADTRRRKIRQLRYGMLSTIKTSPQGITGTGANLYAESAGKKETLGA